MVGDDAEHLRPATEHTLDDLLGWARSVLGPSVTTSDRSWRHQRSLVLELRDAAGDRWFLKHPRDKRRYERETRAYRTILPSFGDLVPRMAGYSPKYKALVVSAVPGQLAKTGGLSTDPAVHRAAGAWLTRLHSSTPTEAPDLAGALATQRAHLLERAEKSLAAAELEYVRLATAALAEVAAAVTVTCHRDFTPRNWVVDEDGTVRVIDFGRTAQDLAVRDLAHLAQRTWAAHPHLRTAFLEGYGRGLDESEQQQIVGFAVMDVVRSMLRMSNRGDLPSLKRWRRVLARLATSTRTDRQ